MTALLLIALMIGGGTTYAAEDAVPGDRLYAIKTEVNEPIKSALAFSATAEAALQAELAEERLREAETLALHGRLTADAASDLSTRLEQHYEEAAARSVEAKEKGDIETTATVQASLEGAMRNSITVLTELNERVQGNHGDSLISEIRARANAAAQAQATATVGISNALEVQVGKTVERADDIIADTKAKLEHMESNTEADTYARVEARIEDAISAHAEAALKLEQKLYAEAYAKAQEAIRTASEAEAGIESTHRLEVRGKGSEGSMIRIDSDVRSHSTSSVRTDTEKNKRGGSVDVETDTTVDTDIIDLDIKSNTMLETNL